MSEAMERAEARATECEAGAKAWTPLEARKYATMAIVENFMVSMEEV